MTSQQLQPFTASIRGSVNYPENLVQRTTYLDVLKTYKTRLDSIAGELCVVEDHNVNVPFRDLIACGPGMHLPSSRIIITDGFLAFERHKVHDDDSLQLRLGEASRTHPDSSKIQQDPRCRLMQV